MKHIGKERVLKGVLAFSTAALMAVGFAPATMFMSDVYVSAEESAAAKLEAGKYTVTANAYVAAEDAPIGRKVYLADSSFPPVNEQLSKSTMEVTEGGEIYITFPVKQETFTLQQIKDGKDIHITNIERGGENKPYDNYPDRITSVTVKLDNTNGEYEFTDCIEYPTLLHTDENWTIHFNVDFSSAVPFGKAVYENTFTEDTNGFSASVTAMSGAQNVTQLENATFKADKLTNGKVYKSAVNSLIYSYENSPTSYDVYELSLASDGAEVDEDENVTYEVSADAKYGENTVVLSTENGFSKVVESKIVDGKVTFTASKLGTYVIADNSTGVEYHYTQKFNKTDVSGASIGWFIRNAETRAVSDFAIFDFGIWSGEDMPEFGIYKGMDLNSYVGRINSIDDLNYDRVKRDDKTTNETAKNYLSEMNVKETAAKLASELGEDEKPVIDGIYTAAVGFDQTNFGNANANEYITSNTSGNSELNKGLKSDEWKTNCRIVATLPVSNDNVSLYKISGTAKDGLTKIEKIDANVSNGNATFTIVNEDDRFYDCGGADYWNSLMGYESYYKSESGRNWWRGGQASDSRYDEWKDNTEIAFIMAVKEEDKPISKPTAVEGLKYTGKEQVGVAEGEGYTLSGTPSATEAGSYTVTATLKDGYVWADGTYDPINLVYNIAKVENVDVGVYTVTANLYCPGELNTQLPGVTAYLTNGNNPLGIGGYDKVAPTEPVYKNAELTVEADGTKYITVDILNPVFTLQEIGECSNAEIVDMVRDDETYVSGVDSSVKREGRITKLKVKLLDDSGKYVFNKCTEFPTLLGVDWNVPLTLEVDFNGNKKPDNSTSQPDNTPSQPDETPSQPDKTPSQSDETSSQTDNGSKGDVTGSQTTSDGSSNSSADGKAVSSGDSSSKAANSASTKNPGTGVRGLAFAGAAICGALCMITGRKSRKDK